MTVVHNFKTLGAAIAHLKKHLEGKERKVKKAISRTLNYAARKIAEMVPIAFADLKGSIEIDGTSVLVVAPHAAAVEVGSRPHVPPLEPLIKWVKLRGMQGLTTTGKVKRIPKVAFNPNGIETGARKSAYNDRMVASTIRAMRRGKKFTNADIPTQIARAIQKGIMIAGTKPQFFVRNSLPAIERELLEQLNKAFDK